MASVSGALEEDPFFFDGKASSRAAELAPPALLTRFLGAARPPFGFGVGALRGGDLPGRAAGFLAAGLRGSGEGDFETRRLDRSAAAIILRQQVKARADWYQFNTVLSPKGR